MPIASLIAASALKAEDIAHAHDMLAKAGLSPAEARVLEPDKAVDLSFSGSIDMARAALAPLLDTHDIIVMNEANRDLRLFVSDMDSTMIAAECIDELADYAGIKAQVEAVTERAMRGEMDFEDALRARVALLKGLSEHAIAECLAHKIRPMPGAHRLVRTLTARGVDCVLVSGGFHQFADVIGAELGFQAVYANRLVIEDGHLTGALEGEIVDAQRKRSVLLDQQRRHGIDSASVMALGDGANDVPMIEAAGIGLAYHAKQVARDAAKGFIAHGDLTVILYALGIARKDWKE